MAYSQHRDFNGEIVQEGIGKLYQREVALASPNTEITVEIPSNSVYGIVFSDFTNEAKIKAKINDFDFVSIRSQGTMFSPILGGIKTLVITCENISTTPLELVFIE